MGLAGGLRAGYFASLGAAYMRGDLSLVYPLARGTALVLLPLLAMLFLREQLSLVGAIGVATVVLGVYVIQLPGLARCHLWAPLRAIRSPYARYATLTGLIIASYGVVDKWNISAGVPPVVYVYLTTPLAALLLTPIVLRRPAAATAEWRANRQTIPVAALLMVSSFLLVVFALRFTPVSYVAAARELGIVFSTFLGSIVQREGYLPVRLIGASVIVLGVVLLGAAH